MRKIILPSEAEKVYDFIVAYITAHRGLSPTQQDIAQGCFMSRTTVQKHLTFLHASGRIGWMPGAKRAIWLLSDEVDDK